MRRRLDDPAPAPALAATVAPAAAAAEAVSSVSTIIACRRFAPADTASGSGIVSAASAGAVEDGSGGNAVKVKGDSGDIGKGCITDDIVVDMRGFSFACRADANARGLRVRVGGAVEGSGRAVGAGGEGEGGVDDGAVVAVAIGCDNFDGASVPYIPNLQLGIRMIHERKERGTGLTCSRGGGCCGTAGALFARGKLELTLSLAAALWPSFLFELSSSSSSSSSSRARIASRRASTQSITRPIVGGVSESDTPCWIIWSRSAQAAA